MKKFIGPVIALVAVIGFCWFSLYAYKQIDNSHADDYSKQLKAVQAQNQKQVAILTEQIKREIERRDKAQEMLLALLPDKKEEIGNIFKSIIQPAVENPPAAEDKTADKKEGKGQ
jgi:Tfp pilus assembly protein PilO